MAVTSYEHYRTLAKSLIERWESLALECDREVNRALNDDSVRDVILAMAGSRSVTLCECADDMRELFLNRPREHGPPSRIKE